MSKIKKAKKLRRPNIPMASGAAMAAGGGMEAARESQPGRSDTATVTFDYTHIRRDLTRILILAGSFFVVLVVLSFIIK